MGRGDTRKEKNAWVVPSYCLPQPETPRRREIPPERPWSILLRGKSGASEIPYWGSPSQDRTVTVISEFKKAAPIFHFTPTWYITERDIERIGLDHRSEMPQNTPLLAFWHRQRGMEWGEWIWDWHVNSSGADYRLPGSSWKSGQSTQYHSGPIPACLKQRREKTRRPQACTLPWDQIPTNQFGKMLITVSRMRESLVKGRMGNMVIKNRQIQGRL